jgi:thymidylate kinase
LNDTLTQVDNGGGAMNARVNTCQPESGATIAELLRALPCRWCLLRDADPDDGIEIEYDVLVDGDRRSVRRAMIASGALPIRSWGRSPHRQFTWWDDSRRRLVRIDIVDQLGFGSFRELVIDARDTVLDSVAARDGWPRPHRADEQWLAMLHALLDRGGLRPRDIARMQPWSESGDHDVVARALPPSLSAELAAAATSADWAALEARREAVRAALRHRRPLGSAGRRVWRSTMMRSTKLQRAILRPGVRIALLGPDGAGKSSTIDALIRVGVVESSVYLGVAPAGHRRSRTIPGISLVLTIRRLLGAWISSSIRRRRGHSVALDRHPLEAVIGPPTRKRTTRARRWILAHVLPQPEVVVVLMAPPEVLHDRKPEHDLDHVVAKRDRYLELARRRHYRVIDTTAPLSDVVDGIRRAIHDAQRHEGAA